MSPSAVEETLLQREEVSSAVIDAILAAVERLGHPDPGAVVVQIEDGPPGQAILNAAGTCGADLIVVGATGGKGLRRLLLGSVAAEVVREARASVLVTREGPETGLILLAVDFSRGADGAVAAAVMEARRRQGRLCLLHSLEVLSPEIALGEPGLLPPAAFGSYPAEDLRASAHRRLSEVLARLGVPGEVEVVDGPPAISIGEAAKVHGAELVVVGSSARSGIDRFLLGSVAAAVVRDAPSSVLVARETKTSNGGAAPG
jgi:nucleotide-binding universal stress UspA family protein